MEKHGDNANTYGAHLLVDFSPIDEADKIIEECHSFLHQAQQTVFSLPLHRSGTKSWRVKRRDTRLLALHQELHPRVLATEKKLRAILGEVVEKKAALRIQARHLVSRLESCIEYNKQQMEGTDVPMEELRGVINKLSGESSSLKDMIEFNKEILRWANVERVSKGQTVMRWGTGRNADRGFFNREGKQKLTEAELMKDDTHPDIETRLIVLRKLREKFVSALASILETRGSFQVNVDNCEKALGMVRGILSRGSIMAVDSLDLLPTPLSPDSDSKKGQYDNSNGNNNNNSNNKAAVDGSTANNSSNIQDSAIASSSSSSGGQGSVTTSAQELTVAMAPFDHSRCTDCSYGYSMTHDCAAHLEALQKQALGANDRLHRLVELREQLYEEVERLAVGLPSTPGDPKSSSFSDIGSGSSSSCGSSRKDDGDNNGSRYDAGSGAAAGQAILNEDVKPHGVASSSGNISSSSSSNARSEESEGGGGSSSN